MPAETGALHHVEIYLQDLPAAIESFGWLLEELGYEKHLEWDGGRSWLLGLTYVAVGAAQRPGIHDRRSAGLNHLAFHAGTTADVDRLWELAPRHGWNRLYTDRHPRAGGEENYIAFLENSERFKVELIADV